MLKVDLAGHDTRALFDTGAGVSLISSSLYEVAKSRGCVVGVIPDAGVTLANASGRPMRVSKVVRLRMKLLGREITVPIVVCPVMNQEMIIGMNVIRDHNLTLNPKTGTVSFVEAIGVPTSNTLGKEMRVVSCSETVIPFQRVKAVEVALIDAGTGDVVKGQHEVFIDRGPLGMSLQRTTEDGRTTIYVSNHNGMDVTVARREQLGLAFPRSEFQIVSPLSSEARAELAGLTQTQVDAVNAEKSKDKKCPPS